MSRDLENVVKAKQAAALLAADLRALVMSDNLLLSDLALAEVDLVERLHTRLARLQSNLEATEAPK